MPPPCPRRHKHTHTHVQHRICTARTVRDVYTLSLAYHDFITDCLVKRVSVLTCHGECVLTHNKLLRRRVSYYDAHRSTWTPLAPRAAAAPRPLARPAGKACACCHPARAAASGQPAWQRPRPLCRALATAVRPIYRRAWAVQQQHRAWRVPHIPLRAWEQFNGGYRPTQARPTLSRFGLRGACS